MPRQRRPLHLDDDLGFTIERPRPGEDLLWINDIQGVDPNRVWTIIEPDHPRAHWRAAPGIRLVNRLGFIITKEPHKPQHEDMDIVLDGLPA